jgi:hypothetical protein
MSIKIHERYLFESFSARIKLSRYICTRAGRQKAIANSLNSNSELPGISTHVLLHHGKWEFLILLLIFAAIDRRNTN